MKSVFIKKFPLIVVSACLISTSTIVANAQQNRDSVKIAQRAIETQDRLFEGSVAPRVIEAGTVNVAGDHYFEVEVMGEPLERIKVVCVTFHELKGVKVVDSSGREIPHQINYGFEEFTITFNEPVATNTTVRTIIEGSTVSGINTGIFVPYRIFATSTAFGEIPVGTAVVRTPSEN